MPSKTTIFLAEEDDIIRLGHRHLIEKSGQFELVGESDDIDEIRNFVTTYKPSIIVLSWTLSPEVFELARSLAKSADRPRILLVLSSPQDFLSALRTYAHGYILKQAQSWVVPVCLDALARGTCFIEPYIAGWLLEGDGRFHLNTNSYASSGTTFSIVSSLTPKEKEVMHLLCDRLSNSAIANALGISIETVRVHIKSIYRKLSVGTREEAVLKMRQLTNAVNRNPQNQRDTGDLLDCVDLEK